MILKVYKKEVLNFNNINLISKIYLRMDIKRYLLMRMGQFKPLVIPFILYI